MRILITMEYVLLLNKKYGGFMFEVLKKCFSINLNDYEKINVKLEINKVVLGTLIALIIGVIFFNLYRGTIKLVVAQLVRHNAKNEDNAKTLSEIDLDKNKAVRWMLSGENLLTKIVGRRGEKRYEYEEYKALSKKERQEAEKFDIDAAEFYVRDEQSSLASTVVEGYGTSVMRTVVACVFIAIVGICIIACMPEILELINNLL